MFVQVIWISFKMVSAESANGVIDSSVDKESVKTFTDDEAALYDRQIRLWGVDAQKRYAKRIFFRSINEMKVIIIHNYWGFV